MSPMSPGVVASEHSEVTSVIRHRVKEGQQNTYEGLLREIVPIAAKFPWPSRRECHTAAAGTSEYTVVLHFDTIDNLRGWLDSAERRQLIGKALPFLQPLAPTQSEPPLVVAQAVVLLAFVALGALAVIRFHPEIKTVV